MSGLQIGVLAYLALSAVITVSMIGKERTPTTPAVATFALLIIMMLALGTVIWG